VQIKKNLAIEIPCFVSVIAILTLMVFENTRGNGEGRVLWVLAPVCVAAILAATWIFFQQYARRARERDASTEKIEIVGVLQCLRDEIEVMAEGFACQVQYVIDASVEDNIFRCHWYPAERQFMAFDTWIGQIGNLPDDALSRNIMRTYAQARALMLTVKMHAFLLEEAKAAKARFHAQPTDADETLIAGYDLGLQDYRDKLRCMHIEITASVGKLLSALDQYLVENSCR